LPLLTAKVISALKLFWQLLYVLKAVVVEVRSQVLQLFGRFRFVAGVPILLTFR